MVTIVLIGIILFLSVLTGLIGSMLLVNAKKTESNQFFQLISKLREFRNSYELLWCLVGITFILLIVTHALIGEWVESTNQSGILATLFPPSAVSGGPMGIGKINWQMQGGFVSAMLFTFS